MKSLTITVMALAFVSGACAQSAKVLPLSDKDAAEIKALYAQQEAIYLKIEAFKEHVRRVYIATPQTDGQCIHGYGHGMWATSSDGTFNCVKDGWSLGFSYSDDFKYIMAVPALEYNPPLNSGGLGCTYTTIPTLSTTLEGTITTR